MTSSTASVAGTFNRPQLRLRFHPHATHPGSASGKTLRQWVEEYLIEECRGVGYYSRPLDAWVMTAVGTDPARKLLLAGFTIDFSEATDPSLANVIDIDELALPITRLSANGANALVLPRLLGFEKTKQGLGAGAAWDREKKRFYVPVADAMKDGRPRAGIIWEPEIIRAAQESLGRVITRSEIADAVAAAAAAKDPLEMDADDLAALHAAVGDVPDWFGLDLFAFQRIGAVAVAAGHFGLFDEPGLGKTRQTIAAASILGAERTLITCLPVGLTGWGREVAESQLHTLGGKNPGGEIVIIRSGKKEPETLPEKGVIITSDSLIAARPALMKRLVEWQPDFVGYDEAHRGKTFESIRSKAMLEISTATRLAPVAITGTPLFANPSELAPLLEFSGHLGPVFGGKAAFLDRYCKPDNFGGFKPRRENLPELRAVLSKHVWVRRRKRDVLPDLPRTLMVPKWVDVPLTEYRKAHKDAADIITRWVVAWRKEHKGEDPSEEVIKEFALSQVGLVSLLRRAAGIAKIPAIVEDIQKHVEETREVRDGRPYFPRPLIVWTHHRDVSAAMSDAVPSAIAESGVIRGGVAHAERDRLVAKFQENRLPVLVCSIAAAGVAITLTAASDMFFAESDWTPAAVRQAMDRAERIGQTADKILATTYLAPGTLDARIQEVLKQKSKTLDAIYGAGNDVSVYDSFNTDDDVASASEIIIGLVHDVLAGRKPQAGE